MAQSEKPKRTDPRHPSRQNKSVVDSPAHYQNITIKNKDGQTIVCEVADIAEALFTGDLHFGTAFIYMARAGKKPQTSYVEDGAKADWWIR